MRGAEVGGHFFGVVEVGYGGGEMRLAGQKDAFGRRFRNDTERLEKLFEMYTNMTTKVAV